MNYQDLILAKDQILQDHGDYIDADFSKKFKTDRVAVHWLTLKPNSKSSSPHAESEEEEFIYVVKGYPHVWINGYLYQLEPGLAVGFKAGTGISHCFINNTSETAELVIIGERTKKTNKCAFPVNPEFKETVDIFWENPPAQEMGPHDGQVGKLDHQKNWQELSFIKNAGALEYKTGFSYPDDNEKFGYGPRLSNHLDLPAIGIWHQTLQKGMRSAWPHAHKCEEEMCLVLKGTPKVWLNGFLHQLKAGDCVYFKPKTNINHVVINDSDEDAIYLGIGEAVDQPEEKINYIFHEERNQNCKLENWYWEDAPVPTDFGNDSALPINTNTEIIKVQNASAFLDKASALLYESEAEYSLVLGLSELKKNSTNDNYQYYLVYKNNVLLGAAVLTELALIITMMPEPDLNHLVKRLIADKALVAKVVGPSNTAETFTRLYTAQANKNFKLDFSQFILKLETVKMPEKISGKLALAHDSQLEVLTKWRILFSEESLPNEVPTYEQALEQIKTKINKNELYVWLDDNNQPVSCNMVGRPTTNGISVSFVYTPIEQRKKGYASALVAGTSQKMLDAGKKFCVLYTDAANPTSNKIYQQIGYESLAKSKVFLLKD